MASVAGYGESTIRSVPAKRGTVSRYASDAASSISPTTLSQLVETQIIPRLVIVHAHDDDQIANLRAVAPFAAADVDTLVPLSLGPSAEGLFAHVDALLARGISVDSLLVDLLAPTARRLGEMWENDTCDFVDVTMGLWRLQQLVHEISARRHVGHPRGHRALFAAFPGCQHSFGTTLVDEVFRGDGWDTELAIGIDERDLTERLAGGWFDLVGLTVSQSCHIDRVAPVIRALRSVSANPHLCVMVGGPAFVADQMQALRVGADATAPDARQALRMAAGLMGAPARKVAAG